MSSRRSRSCRRRRECLPYATPVFGAMCRTPAPRQEPTPRSMNYWANRSGSRDFEGYISRERDCFSRRSRYEFTAKQQFGAEVDVDQGVLSGPLAGDHSPKFRRVAPARIDFAAASPAMSVSYCALSPETIAATSGDIPIGRRAARRFPPGRVPSGDESVLARYSRG
jgi:hypothetical protein